MISSSANHHPPQFRDPRFTNPLPFGIDERNVIRDDDEVDGLRLRRVKNNFLEACKLLKRSSDRCAFLIDIPVMHAVVPFYLQHQNTTGVLFGHHEHIFHLITRNGTVVLNLKSIPGAYAYSLYRLMLS